MITKQHAMKQHAISARPSRTPGARSTFTPKRSGAARRENARASYERYLALARAEAQVGHRIEAENYYQHAEHYLRSMASEAE